VEKKSGAGVSVTEEAQQVAEELGVDLDTVEGTGSEGTVTARDVVQQTPKKVPTSEVTSGTGARLLTEEERKEATESLLKAVVENQKQGLKTSIPAENAGESSIEGLLAEAAQQEAPQQETLGTPTSSTRRLNVVFSESAYSMLKDLAEESGKTISDVVRDAIALQRWFNGVRREGGRILVEQRGRVREIMNIR